jgi:hypothetical protein
MSEFNATIEWKRPEGAAFLDGRYSRAGPRPRLSLVNRDLRGFPHKPPPLGGGG